MKVSVIIPVYNTEAYLQECVESVLNQTCKDMEILLIDDGSGDRSGEICDAYAARYPYVRALHLNHCGAGRARNEGLRNAKGEYIVFADADDYLPQKESIQKMVDLLEETEADVAVGNYFRLWNGQPMDAIKHRVFSQMDQKSGSFRYCAFFSVCTLSYVWGKVYRHSFLRERDISFGSYEYAEDKMFNFKCCVEQARYVFYDDLVYTYRKNDGSISHLPQHDRAACWLEIAEDLLHYLEEKDLQEEYGDLVVYTINFAAFFDGRLRYSQSGRKVRAIKELLRIYAQSPVAYHSFCQLSRGKYIRYASGIGWKVVMWSFATLMRANAFGILALGIKLLVDLRIDERLSDTGLKKSK